MPPIPLDDDGDGFPSDVDCDDTDARIHPGSLDILDGIDNDCDEILEEDADQTRFVDLDGDGFGARATEPTGAANEVLDRGDCDDADANVHPGAPELNRDGLDADCGGSDVADPFVGLPFSPFPTVQAAILAAPEGTTIWVGPGSYPDVEINPGGKRITLASIRGPSATSLDAVGLGTVVVIASGEAHDTLIDGFTLTHGVAPDGGGMLIQDSSPTIRWCRFESNRAGSNGGGAFISGGAPTFTACTFANNVAGESGGGVYGVSTELVLMSVRISSVANYGGAAYLHGSSVVATGGAWDSSGAVNGGALYQQGGSTEFRRGSLSGNSAEGGGGAVYLDGGSATFDHTILADNSAYNSGGAIRAGSASLRLRHCTVARNSIFWSGGGISLNSASLSLENSLMIGNVSQRLGGGIDGTISTIAVSQSTIVGNDAYGGGGGISLADPVAASSISHSILAFNLGWNLSFGGDPALLSLERSDLYQPFGPNHNLGTLSATNLAVDPGFVRWSNDLDSGNDDFHLKPGAQTVDAGDPDALDPDGSVADLGAYGGAQADWSFYVDSDDDGLYDPWEEIHGLDPASDDGLQDADQDGLTNAEELTLDTDPHSADSDDDGALDGAEVAAGSDPLEICLRPGIPAPVPLEVPGDFATLQEAVDAIRYRGAIRLATGETTGSVQVRLREIHMVGAGGSSGTMLRGSSGGVLSARQAALSVEGLTLSGGNSRDGGGLSLRFGSGTVSDIVATGNVASGNGGGIELDTWNGALEDIVATGNTAVSGGGISLGGSTLTIQNLSATENTGSYGGGLAVYGGSVSALDVTLANNSVDQEGGGLYLQGGSGSTFTDFDVRDNYAEYHGGGLSLESSSATLIRLVVRWNQTRFDSGGGLYLRRSSPTLLDSIVRENQANHGAGVWLDESSPTFDRVEVIDNSGNTSVGIGMSASSPVLTRCVIAGNVASYDGGGLALYSGSAPTLMWSVIIDNHSGDEGGGILSLISNPVLRNCEISFNSAVRGGGLNLSGNAIYQAPDGGPIIQQSVLYGNNAETAPGVYVTGDNGTVWIDSSIIAYHPGFNLYSDPGAGMDITITFSDLFNPADTPNHNLELLDASNQTVEPQFNGYDVDGLPLDLHLSLDSPLVDAGGPELVDVDGSRADLGVYGGPDGDGWDLDGDGYPTWFWPGGLEAAPDGFSPDGYDRDDGDASVH